MAEPLFHLLLPFQWLAYWIHHWDPYIFTVPWGDGIIGPRWYGLGYVAGFVISYFLLLKLSREERFPVKPGELPDFVMWASILGVLMGGRLGSMLFYDLERFLANPVSFFYVWEGGMSSHGGVLGLMIFLLVWAKIKNVNWVALGDGVVAVAPVGIFLVRCANFINGELFGRATQVNWAVQFPTEITSHFSPEQQQVIFYRANQIQPGIESVGQLANAAQTNPQIAELLSETLTPRHPSQLYEAFLEGALLFAILWVLKAKFRPPTGLVTGLFFVLYAVFRILVENVREPDIGIDFTMGLTRGQFLSVFMILIGAAFLGYAWVQWKKESAPQPEKPTG